MYKKQMVPISAYNISALLYNFFLFFLLPICGYAASYSSNKESNTELHIAAKHGDIGSIKALLRKLDNNVNKKDKNGWAPIHYATVGGHISVIEVLLSQRDIDVNIKNCVGNTPLIIAAQCGYIEIVEILLSQPYIDVNAKNDHLNTSLHYAISGEHITVVNALLSQPSINVNAKNKCSYTDEYTPLDYAISVANITILNALLKHPSIEVNTGNITPLHRAVSVANFTLWKKLLPELSVYANEKGVSRKTISDKVNVAIVNALLAHPNININKKDKEGQTPLHYAALEGNVTLVNTLLAQSNIDVNAKDEHENTPLDSMLSEYFYGPSGCFQLLLRSDIEQEQRGQLNTIKHTDIELQICGALSKDKYNRNTSIGKNYLTIFKALLKHPSIDVNANKDQGFFRGCSTTATMLHTVAYRGNVALAKILLTHPQINVNAKDKYDNVDSEKTFGFTPLYLASRRRHSKMVKVLLTHRNIDVNLKVAGLTPLHAAIAEPMILSPATDGYIAPEKVLETVKIFLAHRGVDVHTKEDISGNTLLHSAVIHGDKRIVEIVLKIPNILVNEQNKDGHTPLHIAAKYGQLGIVKSLLKYPNIDLHVKGSLDQCRPIDYAVREGHTTIIQALLRYKSRPLQ